MMISIWNQGTDCDYPADARMIRVEIRRAVKAAFPDAVVNVTSDPAPCDIYLDTADNEESLIAQIRLVIDKAYQRIDELYADEHNPY